MTTKIAERLIKSAEQDILLLMSHNQLDAFRTLVDSYVDRVFVIAYLLFSDEESCTEAVETTFLDFWRKRNSTSFLEANAFNQLCHGVVEQYRKNSKNEFAHGKVCKLNAKPPIKIKNVQAEDVFKFISNLRAVLEKLSIEQKIVLVLFFVGKLGTEDISTTARIPRRAVDVYKMQIREVISSYIPTM
jgi:DNA-directed RNA polymerase specialized sigma24 family protein